MDVDRDLFYESSENRGIPFRDVWSEISGEFSKLENFRRLRFEEVDVFLPFFFFSFPDNARAQNNAY